MPFARRLGAHVDLHELMLEGRIAHGLCGELVQIRPAVMGVAEVLIHLVCMASKPLLPLLAISEQNKFDLVQEHSAVLVGGNRFPHLVSVLFPNLHAVSRGGLELNVVLA